MDFSCSKEQEELKHRAAEFAGKELCTATVTGDGGPFSRQQWKACGEFGVQGAFIDRNYGGLGLDFSSGIFILEGLGKGGRDNGLLFSLNAHIWGCAFPLQVFGTDEQKKEFLPRLCSGELIGAHAATEPESGSDLFSLTTRAERKGDRYVLNGAKTFVTNGPVADIAVVYALLRCNGADAGITCFLVEKDRPGFVRGKSIEKMGLRTSPFGELIFQDCEIPAEHRLGKEGEGKLLFNLSMDMERSFIFASQIGAMERQLDECVRYAKTRQQFGKKIGEFEAVGNMLADMKVRLETSRLLVYKQAWLKDRDIRSFIDSSLTKLYVSECMVKNSLSAVRIFGGYGYTTECGIEQQLRDAVGALLCSGTSEIQRDIINRLL